jgi:hypothetical protein
MKEFVEGPSGFCVIAVSTLPPELGPTSQKLVGVGNELLAGQLLGLAANSTLPLGSTAAGASARV